MRLLDSLVFRIGAFFQRSKVNAEMEEELRSHIEHRADDLERSGLGRAEAERRARVEFGGRVKYTEEIQNRWAAILLGRFWRMCVTACACCASLPASPLRRF